jgi:hypothetical protein
MTTDLALMVFIRIVQPRRINHSLKFSEKKFNFENCIFCFVYGWLAGLMKQNIEHFLGCCQDN